MKVHIAILWPQIMPTIEIQAHRTSPKSSLNSFNWCFGMSCFGQNLWTPTPCKGEVSATRFGNATELDCKMVNFLCHLGYQFFQRHSSKNCLYHLVPVLTQNQLMFWVGFQGLACWMIQGIRNHHKVIQWVVSKIISSYTPI